MATKCPICGRDDAEIIEPGTIDGIVFRCPTPTHGEFAVSESVRSTLEGNVGREDWESALEKARMRVVERVCVARADDAPAVLRAAEQVRPPLPDARDPVHPCEDARGLARADGLVDSRARTGNRVIVNRCIRCRTWLNRI
jgi:hypothetical protein